jgi:hypothetical protein
MNYITAQTLTKFLLIFGKRNSLISEVVYEVSGLDYAMNQMDDPDDIIRHKKDKSHTVEKNRR